MIDIDYCKLFNNKKTSDGRYIAYRKLDGNSPSIVFFGGFASSMNGDKAVAIYNFCKVNGIALLLFDYFGHGYSSGDFVDYVISDWKDNCIEIINELTVGKQIILGSSMGSWLMFLVSIEIPEKILALIGISSAPDFTENLIFNKLSNNEKEKLHFDGVLNFKSGDCSYKITSNLINDGRKNLILNKETIDINVPVRLLHSFNDKDVPYQISLDLAKKIKSRNVIVNLIKSGNHSMSDVNSLKVLFNLVKEFY